MGDLKTRYVETAVREDLPTKMVFLGGPRQVGKTTLAQMIAESAKTAVYLNWDHRPHRQAILGAKWPPETDFLVFDEIHKYARWKSLIKGIWDTRGRHQHIMVTGSSRLDVFRRGGDSLLGRYHYFRLHPFSLRELSGSKPPATAFPKAAPDLVLDTPGTGLDDLLRLGGFPEPLLAGSERTLKRWQHGRFERVFREDIRATEAVHELSQVELLGALMPGRVGSPLSLRSLAEDVEVSPVTLKSWVELLSRNYYVFKVPPYHRRLERALKKEAKYYLWDWSEVEDRGARFENLVGSHLLKFSHWFEDVFGLRVELYYVRDREKREVDFLMVWEGRPWFLVECKLRADRTFTHLQYFGKKLGVHRLCHVTLEGEDDYLDRSGGVRVVPASKFLMALV